MQADGEISQLYSHSARVICSASAHVNKLHADTDTVVSYCGQIHQNYSKGLDERVCVSFLIPGFFRFAIAAIQVPISAPFTATVDSEE